MNRNVLFLSGLIGFVTGCSADKDDMAKLQGTWVVTAIEQEGKTTPQPDGEGSYTFTKDKAVAKHKEHPDKEGAWKIDASKSPKWIDLTDNKEKTVTEGIYELKGDTLKMAFPIHVMNGKRPTSFEDKEAWIMNFKRDK